MNKSNNKITSEAETMVKNLIKALIENERKGKENDLTLQKNEKE